MQRYHDFVAGRSANAAKQILAMTGEQVPGTSPSHPMADYTGTFCREGYTPAVVTAENGALYLDFINAKVKMRHFHYDTFVLDDILGELPAGVPVHFHTAEVGGRIDALAMPLVPEPGGKLIRFEKQRSDEGC